MNKQLVCLLLFISSALVVQAQETIPVKVIPGEIFKDVKKDAADTVSWKWKRSGLYNFNFAQGSLSNWASGGDKFSLSLNSYFNYYLLHKVGKHTWDNNVDVNFGFLQSSSAGSRKIDDRVDFLSKYGYRLDTTNKIYISGLFNLRTQLFDGLNYFTKDSGVLTSTFLSPAYITFSIGADYKPVPNFSLFVSPLTSRITWVASDRLAAIGVYGVPAGKHIINQPGAFASINFNKPIFKNVDYRTRLDLFTNYNHNPSNVDFFMTNLFAFRINKYLAATYSLDMIYDDDVRLFGDAHTSPGLQLKSLIGIGFMMPLYTVEN